VHLIAELITKGSQPAELIEVYPHRKRSVSRPAQAAARVAWSGCHFQRAMLLMDGVVRAMYRDPSGEPRHLVPERVERLTINLGHICHTFAAGHRLEVHLTSSNFPRRARNTNSGHPILANDSDTEIRVATNVVHHAESTPSFLELSVAR
jgi:predicted acyl esterase